MSDIDPAVELRNPVWSALSGADGRLARCGARAGRFRPDVAPFGAVADADDPAAWRELAALTGGDAVALLDPVVPAGWEELRTLPAVQMIWAGTTPTRRDDDPPFTSLGPADADAMLALAERTRPGPFERATVEFGGYRGLWDGAGLACMAGERIHPSGWTEISAVCTDPRHAGRGLGTAVVASLVRDVLAAERRPFLHVMRDNGPARRLYERLGFCDHRQVTIRVLRSSR